MKLWKPDDEDPEFELTPMIDVVFLLIAFFMTLISFISSELIELELPQAEKATIPEEPGDRQYISIKENGDLYFGSRPIQYESLSALVGAAREENPELAVFLRADEETPHRHVNKVMGACAEAGVFDLIFASNKD